MEGSHQHHLGRDAGSHERLGDDGLTLRRGAVVVPVADPRCVGTDGVGHRPHVRTPHPLLGPVATPPGVDLLPYLPRAPSDVVQGAARTTRSANTSTRRAARHIGTIHCGPLIPSWSVVRVVGRGATATCGSPCRGRQRGSVWVPGCGPGSVAPRPSSARGSPLRVATP